MQLLIRECPRHRRVLSSLRDGHTQAEPNTAFGTRVLEAHEPRAHPDESASSTCGAADEASGT